MTSVLSCFADSSKWERCAGFAIRRAVDARYSEHLLSGLTIEEIIDIEVENSLLKSSAITPAIQSNHIYPPDITTSTDSFDDSSKDSSEESFTIHEDLYDLSEHCGTRKNRKKGSRARHVSKFEPKVSKRKQRLLASVEKSDSGSTLPVTVRNEQRAYNEWENNLEQLK